MISRSLFFKLYKQEIKTKIWYPMLLFVFDFLVMEIPLLMKLQEIDNFPDRYRYDIKHFFANFYLSPDQNMFLVISTAIVAVITGFLLFSYVHSKQKLDLFHSVPVKRRITYGAKMLCGYTFFAVPFILQMLITFFIGSIKKCFSIHALNNFILLFILLSIFYLAVMAVTVISIMLTGNIVVSFAGVLILQFYGFIISFLKKEMIYNFFPTSVNGYISSSLKIAPADFMNEIVNKLATYRHFNSGITYRVIIPDILALVVATCIYILIGLIMYLYRKSESAGKAIAFGGTEIFIKFLVVIPLSLYSGYFFESVASAFTYPWFIAGVVISFLISSVLMEIVFRFDFMSGFKHWYHIVINGAVLAIIVVMFHFDIFGYNMYLPDKNNLEYISVSIDGIYDVYTEDYYYSMEYYAPVLSPIEYRMQNIKITDEKAYELAKALVNNKSTHRMNSLGKEYNYQEDNENTQKITFGYHLKNGRTVYREYKYDITNKEITGKVGDVFELRDYKLGAAPIFKNGWNKNIVSIHCEGNYDDDDLNVSEKEKNEFLNIYHSEYMKLTFDEVINSKPEARIDFYIEDNNGQNKAESGYGIYSSFNQTIDFLEKRNINFDMNAFMEMIRKATVTCYVYDANMVSENGEIVEHEYTDTDDIKEILTQCVGYGPNSLTPGYYNKNDKYELDVDFIYYDEDGDKNYRYMTFYNKNVPDFVLKDFSLY